MTRGTTNPPWLQCLDIRARASSHERRSALRAKLLLPLDRRVRLSSQIVVSRLLILTRSRAIIRAIACSHTSAILRMRLAFAPMGRSSQASWWAPLCRCTMYVHRWKTARSAACISISLQRRGVTSRLHRDGKTRAQVLHEATHARFLPWSWVRLASWYGLTACLGGEIGDEVVGRVDMLAENELPWNAQYCTRTLHPGKTNRSLVLSVVSEPRVSPEQRSERVNLSGPSLLCVLAVSRVRPAVSRDGICRRGGTAKLRSVEPTERIRLLQLCLPVRVHFCRTST